MEKSKIVKVGIAGLGRSGWDIHVRRLLEHLQDKYNIVAVFDKDITRQKEAIAKFGCKAYSDYKDLLQDKEVELVVVAMPSHLHADFTIQALESGKGVVCEKPMTTSIKDADRMIKCAKKTGRILSVFQNKRYSPDFVKVKEIIDSGVLGRIVMIRISYHGFGRRWDWQTLKRFGGGTLNNTCPHPLDQSLVLFGEEQPDVFCIRDKTLTLGDADDHVKIILSSSNGSNAPTIEIEVTGACAYPQGMWLVMGTQGGLSGTGSMLKWKYFDPKKLPKREVKIEPSDRSYNQEDVPWVEKTWTIEEDKSPGEKGFYLDLYETLRHGKPLVISPEDVRRQMRVLDKCRKLTPL